MKVLGALKAAAAMTWLAIILCVSLFTGLMIATAGAALYTPLFEIAAPIVCDGEFKIVSQRYSNRPGQSGVTRTIYCRNTATGEQTEITFYTVFIAFLLYSALVFVALLLLTPVLIVPVRLLKGRLKPGAAVAADFNAFSARLVGAPGSRVTSVMPARIVFNGREYKSADEMPADARAAYEQAMSVFKDSDRNGVPDLFESGVQRAQTPAAGDTAARLTKLKELRAAGLVTEQEYEAKKAEILSEL